VLLIGGSAAAKPQRGAGPRADAIPSVGDRTTGMKRVDGFFPMYWDDAGGRRFVSVLWAFQIAGASDGRVLVDFTDFLVRDANDVAGRLQPGSYRFEAGRSTAETLGTGHARVEQVLKTRAPAHREGGRAPNLSRSLEP
jgi:hypothetical protein